jgi:leucyl-tRNA synthetase
MEVRLMTANEMEKSIQEIWKLFKETDRILKEKFKETDERFKETDRILKEKFKETDERFKETDREIDKLSKTVENISKTAENISKTSENTNKAVYALTGKWSRFVEGLIAPAVERLFKERGIEVDKVFQRVKTRRNGSTMEVDILAINGEYAVLIEAKSTLKIEDVKEHIVRLERFKTFFPEYSGRKVVGAVGGIVIEEESDKYAYRNGLFVIGESGETAVILNDKNFQPKVW